LYAVGDFTTAGGITVNRISRWDGSSWFALGGGLSGGYPDLPGYDPHVEAVVVDDGSVYAGGFFSMAGGDTVNGVAMWDGASWSDLDGGIGGVRGPSILGMTVYEGDLYAGGYFHTAGGVSVKNIAKWDGSVWSDVGGGVGDNYDLVYDLITGGAFLYAGGGFDFIGGVHSPRIARWDGAVWSSLAGGLGGSGGAWVEAMAFDNGNLYAAGYFRRAGDHPSLYFARLGNLPTGIVTRERSPASSPLGQNYPNPFNPSTTIRYEVKETTRVILKIYSIDGRKIKTLVDRVQTPRQYGYLISWDGTNESGVPVASGIYLYRLVTKEGSIARKMVLLK
jgi:hypothetical protein